MALKTISHHELRLHAWWNDTVIYSDQFFDATSALNFETLEFDVTNIFHELMMIRHSFAEADYPDCAKEARTHLLRSMNLVVIGFKEFMGGNTDCARRLMSDAQTELHQLEYALARIGVPVMYLEQRVH